MKIAYVSSARRGRTDQLMTEIAQHFTKQGKCLAGIVKEQSHVSQFENGCDMKVRVLPSGPIVQITQNLGGGSNACRLDPSAIAQAVSVVETHDMEKAELFLLNKFGPEEAGGRGFISAISNAVEHDVPVLVGVGAANISAFETFAGGTAQELPDDLDALKNWCLSSLTKQSVGSPA